MALRPKKLIGMKYEAFQIFVKSGNEFHLQKARLIPCKVIICRFG